MPTPGSSISATTADMCPCCGETGCYFTLPPTSSTPYPNEAAAQAAIDDFVFECILYSDPVTAASGTTVTVLGGQVLFTQLASAPLDEVASISYLMAPLKAGTLYLDFSATFSGVGDIFVTMRVTKNFGSPITYSQTFIGSTFASGTGTVTIPVDDIYEVEINIGAIDYPGEDPLTLNVGWTLRQDNAIAPCPVRAGYGDPIEYVYCELP
jgi:hypothetical protein